MSLNADTLLDRIYLKGQITRWRLLAILFGVIALFALIHHSSHSSIDGDHVARMSFEGIITDDQEVYDMIDDAADDKKIKAVIIWLNTPGGSAVGGEEIFLRLRKLAEKKPVVAVMRSISASAGYMIALGADQIFAREGTITGSIGVLIETAEVTDLIQKIGIKPVVIKSAPLKGSPSPFEKTTPEVLRTVQDVVDDFYKRFVQMVQERRNLTRERAVALSDGRIYSGKRAVDLKLIDAIGGEDEAMKWLQEQRKIPSDLKIEDIKPHKDEGLLARLSQSMAGKFFQNSSMGLDGVSAIWHPNVK